MTLRDKALASCSQEGRPMADLEHFRAETRKWLLENSPVGVRGLTLALGEGNGGGGLSKAEAKILREEMAALKLPEPLSGFGLTMIGPVLLQYGTEEQKRE